MWWLGASVAVAATCPQEMKVLDAAKGDAVAPAFASVAKCDLGVANSAFPVAMKRTGDVDSLAALTYAALDAGLTGPVVGMLDAISDYSARTELTRAVGGACGETPARLAFVKSLTEIKGRGFVTWADAVSSCPAPDVDSALAALVGAPPKASFDDKYSAVLDIYARRRNAEALPLLEQAAAASMDGGPFNLIVETMQKAVTPAGIGAKPSDADRDALIASLGRLGQNASPEVARHIADVMIKVGSESQAVALLPKMYPTKVQGGGGFLYGLAATETCGSSSVIHYATVQEPGKRWNVQADAAAAAKAFKPKLKCGADLQVQTSAEPVTSAEEVTAWAEKLAASSAGAKLKAEKPVILQ